MAPGGVPLTLYTMLGSCILVTKSVRATLPSLVPLIAQSQGLAESQAACVPHPVSTTARVPAPPSVPAAHCHSRVRCGARLLMSAFYPGYLLTQIPAGALAQKYGSKLMLGANLLGTAACFGCLPLAFAASGGVLLPAALLTTMGLFQGALIPGEAAIHSIWLQDSPARPFILQTM